MSFADIKAQMRRDVHASFAVPCHYVSAASGFDRRFDIDFDGQTITARFQDRLQQSNSGGGGWAQIIEGVTRVTFNREELEAAGIVPAQFDVVEFIDYGVSAKLQLRDPYDGPIEERWTVSAA